MRRRCIANLILEPEVRDGYGLEPEEVNLAVEWLRLNPPDEAVPLDAAIELGRRGGPRKGEEKKSGQSRLQASEWNTKVHREARLKNDHPVIFERYNNGEITVTEAARQAGFRRKSTPFEIACGQTPKLTAEERHKLKELLE
jgi:hypothetical protein